MIGRRVRHKFPGFGWHDGEITEESSDKITVVWDDGDSDAYTKSQVQRMLKEEQAKGGVSPMKSPDSKHAKREAGQAGDAADSPAALGSGRSRRARKVVDYRAQEARLDDMDLSCDEEEGKAAGRGSARARKARAVVESEEEAESDASDEGEDDAMEEEEQGEEAASRKRASPRQASRSAVKASPAKGPAKASPAKATASKAVPKAGKSQAKKAVKEEAEHEEEEEGEEYEEEEEEESSDEEGSEEGESEEEVFEKPKASHKTKNPPAKLRTSDWTQKLKVSWSDEQVEELPVIVEPRAMFDDLVERTERQETLKGAALEGVSLAALGKQLEGRPLRIATMCSGTESPLLALELISQALFEAHGVKLNIEHVFSCEIEPFKQAYIERNFAPPLLFRDIRELGEEKATTAYGALQPVPGEVDMLVAGTSCVDYSNLNTKQKGIDEKGESGQTFWGMMRWVNNHRPPIVIQENVCSAPWDSMVKYYEKAGYMATYMRVDTKNHYIPHTRTRVYLVALDTRAKAREGADAERSCGEELARWRAAINELSRPSSSSLEAFLLPTDDPRVHRGREDLARPKDGAGKRAVTDWGRCETRHQRARAEEAIGLKRPLTAWESQGHCTGPDFSWHDWLKGQVERVLDLMDINFLRLAKTGVDANHKTLLWNLSQNVDRTTGSVRPGICPCLTPNMVPYLTNRGGPLIGPEVLSLQGIPVSDLLLTRESEDQMADLAGNAMTSTIVGTCMLAAVLLSQDYLMAHRAPKAAVTATGAAKRSVEAVGALEAAPLCLNAKSNNFSLSSLLNDAVRSARMCASEGREGTAERVHRCLECGATVSADCAAWPEHAKLEPIAEERLDPREFERRLKEALPMCVEIEGLAAAAEMRPVGSLLPESGSSLAGKKPPVAKKAAESAAKRKAEGSEEAAAAKSAKQTPQLKGKQASGKGSASKGSAGKGVAAEESTPAVQPAKKKVATMDMFFKPTPKPASEAKAKEAPTEALSSERPSSPPRRPPFSSDVVRSPVANRSPLRDRNPSSPAKVLAVLSPPKAPPSKLAKGGAKGGSEAESAEEALWSAWLSALTALDGARFYYRGVTRGETWVASYAAGAGELQLHLNRHGAEWLLFAETPSKRGPLRDLLQRPVARMRLGHDTASPLEGAWELCLPQLKRVALEISPLGNAVESYQASIGLLEEWEATQRFKRWSIKAANAGDASVFDGEIEGEYELLDKCGGALGSLHKRVGAAEGAPPMFLMLDPSRTGDPEADCVVIARDHSRLAYGQIRRTAAELDCSWRPWSRADDETAATPKLVEALVRGQWRKAPCKLTQVSFEGARVATPTVSPALDGPSDMCVGGEENDEASTRAAAERAVAMLRCEVPLCAAETALWPSEAWAALGASRGMLSKSKKTFEAIAWIIERLEIPDALQQWAPHANDAALRRWIAGLSPCEVSAPAMPKLQWVQVSRGKVVAQEDPVQAGAYEQRLKRRPSPFVVRYRAVDGKGELEVGANPNTLAMRALAALHPSGLASEAKISWRLVRHSERREQLKSLQLSSNKQDETAPQPPHFQAFAGRKKGPVLGLRPEQQRSLSWMLEQEAEDATPFEEQEIGEEVQPELRWRLETRATMPRLVRGGVLADEVGYGKTVITIALIDSAPRVPRPVPPPLCAEAFIPVKTTLVLAPSHLLKQWPGEVSKFSGGALSVRTVNTMADLNRLSVKELQQIDVLVCSITLFRNDLYYQRLANMAGSKSLPSKSSARHFQQAYEETADLLGKQVARLQGGEVSVAREAVKAGQKLRSGAAKAESFVGKGLGNMQKRVAATTIDEDSEMVAVAAKGKKATYKAEKDAAKAEAARAKEEKPAVKKAKVAGDKAKAKPAPKAKSKAKDKAAAKAKGKRVHESEDESAFEESGAESESDSFEDESEDEKPKQKKKAAAKPKAVKEEADPWGLQTPKVMQDWRKLQAPPLEMFYWNRLVVDEYTYNKERDHIAIVHGLKASARWVLSGTPNISGFAAVSDMAEWLGVRLGRADSSELSKQEKKEQSAVERFQFFKEVHTQAWHAERHRLAQTFLDRFVRQNIAEIDEIPWREQSVRIALPPAERALYVELKNHLEALDMKNNHKSIKAKCKSENDREARLATVLGGSDSPDEALMKRCAHFDLAGGAKNAVDACNLIVTTRAKQLQSCKDEIVKQTAYARDIIDLFEKAHPLKTLDAKKQELRGMPREHFNTWSHDEVRDCGDADANAMLPPLVEEGLARKPAKVSLPDMEKQFKDKMAWARDQVHLLRRLQKELVGRVRSLRFFERVRLQQKGEPIPIERCQGSEANAELGLLSCCGHAAPIAALLECAERQTCLAAGCQAAVRLGNVVPVAELGSEAQGLGENQRYGAKLSAVVRLIERIPKDERILVFVQFADLLGKVQEALHAAGVKTSHLHGSALKRSQTIEAFQQGELEKGTPRVLLLNLRDESAAGANLTQANHAIFLHPLLVQTQQEYNSCDTQAVGRLRRYGQTRVVQLYRFAVQNTIDDETLLARRPEGAAFFDDCAHGDSVAPAQ